VDNACFAFPRGLDRALVHLGARNGQGSQPVTRAPNSMAADEAAEPLWELEEELKSVTRSDSGSSVDAHYDSSGIWSGRGQPRRRAEEHS
jgi:hypothetical protein